jgi:hypothetical protein
MVRMVAITASLLMSSQVGATAVRTRVCGKGKLERKQDPGGKLEPDRPAPHLVGGAAKSRAEHANQSLQGAVADDEDRRSLDGEGDKPCHFLEEVLECHSRSHFFRFAPRKPPMGGIL